MSKAALQYIQLVCLYRLILIRYVYFANLVIFLEENEGAETPLEEKTGEGETPLRENSLFLPEAYMCGYFYHGDHLGSSNYITDRLGRIFEHTIHLPYGEVWIDEGSDTSLLGYKFTGKELDEETGYYYFGARYYDPKISSWISTDPALPKYIPTKSQLYFPKSVLKAKVDLPGYGGVYSSGNLNLYFYSYGNPIKFHDPDGRLPTALPPEFTISSPFGVRPDPFGGNNRENHTGVDQRAPGGTNVHALWSGTVLNTIDTNNGSGGILVIIDHGIIQEGPNAGKHLYSRYLHNSKNAVVPGQKVREGDVVAKSGNTGRSTGPHSHFEAILTDRPLTDINQPDAQKVDPAKIDEVMGTKQWGENGQIESKQQEPTSFIGTCEIPKE
jgi:RHS repeat-associated protein